MFQGRFNSCVLDKPHLLAAVRYVELNPVKTGLVAQAWEYPWSSCRFHTGQYEVDLLVSEVMLPEMVDGWTRFLQQDDDVKLDRVLRGTRTGRPVGDDEFVSSFELLTGRMLHPQSPGRPRINK